MTQTRRAWSWLGTPASVRAISAGMVVYALILAGLVAGYARVSACLTTYNNRAAVATIERTEAAARDRAAQRAMAEALSQTDDLADVRAAAGELVRTIDEGDQARAKNPPPPPPGDYC